MLFNFATWNHNPLGQRSLEDIISLIGQQLRALGHQATWIQGPGNFIKADAGINVIVEGFTEPAVADIARLYGEGCRFLCIAPEEPVPGKGFNHGLPFEMVARQEIFPQAARYFEGIAHLIPGEHVRSWYAQFAPTVFLDLGWSPTMDALRLNRRPEPKYDFGFYGSLSPRRKKIIEKLAKKSGSTVRTVCDFPTQAERNNAMRDCKVSLQIRKFEVMDLISNCRCAMSIQLGCAVVGEPHANPGEYADIVHLSSSLDQFYADAMAARNLWRGIHAGQLRKLKERMTPERCVGHPLAALGLFNGEKLRLAS